MPKINVYLPEDLATKVRAAGVPVSSVCQSALEEALRNVAAMHEGVRNIGQQDGPRIRIAGRLTGRLNTALDAAYHQARTRAQNFVGTEHLALGMLDEGANLGVRVLEALDVDPDDLRAELHGLMTQMETTTGRAGGEPTLTPRAQEVLDLAVKQAAQLGHNYVGCEHLLLGLVIESDGLAGRALRTLGLDETIVRRAVISALTGFVHARANTPSPTSDQLLAQILERLDRLESRFSPN